MKIFEQYVRHSNLFIYTTDATGNQTDILRFTSLTIYLVYIQLQLVFNNLLKTVFDGHLALAGEFWDC